MVAHELKDAGEAADFADDADFCSPPFESARRVGKGSRDRSSVAEILLEMIEKPVNIMREN